MAASGSWLGRLWAWLTGKNREGAAPRMAIPAPHTLVARVSAVEEAQEREMLRLAEESIRRGHPGQAAIVYQKAAERYRRDGIGAKELAVINMWVRVASHDPEPWTALGRYHETAEHRRLALEAYTRAAALWRSVGRDEDADRLEVRMQQLRAGPSVSQDVPPAAGAATPAASADPSGPAEMPGDSVMADALRMDEDSIELDIPETGGHEALRDEPEPEPEPERLPTNALAALPDDDEPEPLSASALEVVHEPAPAPAIPDHETEPGQTYDRTVAGLSVNDLDAPTDDGISAELMAELTAMADEDVTGEEGAATIAMPAIGSVAKRGFGIPDASTVMDPNYVPPVAAVEPEEDFDDEEDFEDEEPSPDQTRGYSADELKELDRLLKERGRR